jgi:hypothetical protein
MGKNFQSCLGFICKNQVNKSSEKLIPDIKVGLNLI